MRKRRAFQSGALAIKLGLRRIKVWLSRQRSMNRSKLQSLLAVGFIGWTPLGLAQDTPKEPDELIRLRQNYNQRRDAALNPINAS